MHNKEWEARPIKKNNINIIYFRKTGVFCETSDLAFKILNNKDKRHENYLLEKYSLQEIDECLKEYDVLRHQILSVSSEISYSNILDANTVMQHQPSGIVLNVAQECNLNCRYCYGSGGTYGSHTPFMNRKIAEASIEHLLKISRDVKEYYITFFGGEPFLNFPIIKYVVGLCREVEKKDNKLFHFSVTTNGTIVNNEIIGFLRENRFGVMVSFDGAKKIHNKNRPFKDGKRSFNTITKNIKRMSRHLPLQGRGTVTKDGVNKNSIIKAIKNARSLGMATYVLSPVDCSKIEPIDLSLNKGKMRKLCNLYERITERNLNDLRKGLRPRIIFDPYSSLIRRFYEGTLEKYHYCGAFFGMATVSTDGDIYPCHRFVGMKEFKIGNVSNGRNKDRIIYFLNEYTKSKESACSDCWINRLCGGICYYTSANSNGSFNPPDPKLCELIRNRYETAMYFMTKYYKEIYEKPNIYLRATRYVY